MQSSDSRYYQDVILSNDGMMSVIRSFLSWNDSIQFGMVSLSAFHLLLNTQTHYYRFIHPALALLRSSDLSESNHEKCLHRTLPLLILLGANRITLEEFKKLHFANLEIDYTIYERSNTNIYNIVSENFWLLMNNKVTTDEVIQYCGRPLFNRHMIEARNRGFISAEKFEKYMALPTTWSPFEKLHDDLEHRLSVLFSNNISLRMVDENYFKFDKLIKFVSEQLYDCHLAIFNQYGLRAFQLKKNPLTAKIYFQTTSLQRWALETLLNPSGIDALENEYTSIPHLLSLNENELRALFIGTYLSGDFGIPLFSKYGIEVIKRGWLTSASFASLTTIQSYGLSKSLFTKTGLQFFKLYKLQDYLDILLQFNSIEEYKDWESWQIFSLPSMQLVLENFISLTQFNELVRESLQKTHQPFSPSLEKHKLLSSERFVEIVQAKLITEAEYTSLTLKETRQFCNLIRGRHSPIVLRLLRLIFIERAVINPTPLPLSPIWPVLNTLEKAPTLVMPSMNTEIGLLLFERSHCNFQQFIELFYANVYDAEHKKNKPVFLLHYLTDYIINHYLSIENSLKITAADICFLIDNSIMSVVDFSIIMRDDRAFTLRRMLKYYDHYFNGTDKTLLKKIFSLPTIGEITLAKKTIEDVIETHVSEEKMASHVKKADFETLPDMMTPLASVKKLLKETLGMLHTLPMKSHNGFFNAAHLNDKTTLTEKVSQLLGQAEEIPSSRDKRILILRKLAYYLSDFKAKIKPKDIKVKSRYFEIVKTFELEKFRLVDKPQTRYEDLLEYCQKPPLKFASLLRCGAMFRVRRSGAMVVLDRGEEEKEIKCLKS